MGKPKKRTSPRASGARRSHLIVKLARAVNKRSPIKAYTTHRESGKKLVAVRKKSPVKKKLTVVK